MRSASFHGSPVASRLAPSIGIIPPARVGGVGILMEVASIVSEPPGPDGMKQLIGMMRATFPDMVVTSEDMVAEGDKVFLRQSTRTTFQRAMPGIATPGLVPSCYYFRHDLGEDDTGRDITSSSFVGNISLTEI